MPILKNFLKGTFTKYPQVRDFVPSWDLPTVPNALAEDPFEPLACLDDIPLSRAGIGIAHLVKLELELKWNYLSMELELLAKNWN